MSKESFNRKKVKIGPKGSNRGRKVIGSHGKGECKHMHPFIAVKLHTSGSVLSRSGRENRTNVGAMGRVWGPLHGVS